MENVKLAPAFGHVLLNEEESNSNTLHADELRSPISCLQEYILKAERLAFLWLLQWQLLKK